MTEVEEEKESQEVQSGADSPPFEEVGEGRSERRNFLSKMLIGVGAVLGLEACVAGFAFLASKPKGEKKPVNVSRSSLKPGKPYQIIYGGKPTLVMTDDKGNIWVLCAICTHLGCIVNYRPENNDFHCPCHDGYFDIKGKVLAGPPPLPLETIPFKEKGNIIVVGEA